MSKKYLAIGAFAVLSALSLKADDYVDLVKRGNEAFQKNNYDEAMALYRDAETELPESTELQYNMAGVLFHEGKYEEAVDLYSKSLNTTDATLGASAHYNQGNTYFRMGDFQNAIKSYENALNLNPEDRDAKFNLELARKRLKEQIKPDQQNQDQQNEQQEKQEQQDQQDQEEQDQQDKQDQQQQQGQQNQNEKQEDQQQQQQQGQAEEQKEMSKEDAERILNGLKDEQEIQKKMKRARGQGNYSGKDW